MKTKLEITLNVKPAGRFQKYDYINLIGISLPGADEIEQYYMQNGGFLADLPAIEVKWDARARRPSKEELMHAMVKNGYMEPYDPMDIFPQINLTEKGKKSLDKWE